MVAKVLTADSFIMMNHLISIHLQVCQMFFFHVNEFNFILWILILTSLIIIRVRKY